MQQYVGYRGHSGLWQAVRPAHLWVHGLIFVPTTGGSIDITNLSCSAPILLDSPEAQVSVFGNGGGNVWVLGNDFTQASTWWNDQAKNGANLFNFNRRLDPINGSVAIPDANPIPSNASILAARAVREHLSGRHPRPVHESCN
jgi:hypothetical protein